MNDQPSNNHNDPFPDEELTDLWNRQETVMSDTADPNQFTHLANAIKAGHRAEQLGLLMVTIREVGAIVLFAVFFAYLGVVENSAMFVSSLLCVGIGLFLAGSSIRQRKIEQQFDTTLRGTVERSLSQARHRFWMYRNVGWWYFTPLVAAVALLWVVTLVDDPNGAKIGDALGIAVMASILGGLFWWARRIAFTKWQPEVERFEALQDDLERQG